MGAVTCIVSMQHAPSAVRPPDQPAEIVLRHDVCQLCLYTQYIHRLNHVQRPGKRHTIPAAAQPPRLDVPQLGTTQDSPGVTNLTRKCWEYRVKNHSASKLVAAADGEHGQVALSTCGGTVQNSGGTRAVLIRTAANTLLVQLITVYQPDVCRRVVKLLSTQACVQT